MERREKCHVYTQKDLNQCSDAEVAKQELLNIWLQLCDGNESEEAKEVMRLQLIEDGFLESVVSKLKNASLREDAAHIVAELAKTESARPRCVSASLIGPLLDILNDGTMDECVETCRALGNICFNNDPARQAVYDYGGLEIIKQLMLRVAEDKGEDGKLVRRVVCGFLFNLINTNGELAEVLSKHVLSGDILEVLYDYVERYIADEDVMHMILLTLGALADGESGITVMLQSGIIKATSRLLSLNGTSVEQLENLISFYSSFIEHDEVKDHFAVNGIFDELLDVLKKYPMDGSGNHSKNEDDDDNGDIENLRKTTLSLIVLILTSDKSLEVLYSQGQGRIVQEAFDWLASSDTQLQISGALALGNIARTESHCVQLVKMGAGEKLLVLLEKYPISSADSADNNSDALNSAGLLSGAGSTVAAQIYHSVLSALKNLAIPVSNKSHLKQCKIIERIKPLSASQVTSIQFKLIGTLRMCVDQQEESCKLLGEDEEFVARMISWCSVEDHEGVQAEASRLVSSLIKHSHSTQVMRTLIKHSAVLPLVKMCSAQHALMQNEALVALTLLSASVSDEAVQSLKDADILAVTEKILTGVSTAPEVLHNSLSLIYSLSQSDIMLTCIKQNKPLQDAIKHHSSHSNEKIRSLVEKILSLN